MDNIDDFIKAWTSEETGEALEKHSAEWRKMMAETISLLQLWTGAEIVDVPDLPVGCTVLHTRISVWEDAP